MVILFDHSLPTIIIIIIIILLIICFWKWLTYVLTQRKKYPVLDYINGHFCW